ncbi:hypothetical protein [Helicobacter sp. 23-1046]
MNKTMVFIEFALVILAIQFVKILGKARPEILLITLSFFVGFFMCRICWWICYGLFFESKNNKKVFMYIYCLLGGGMSVSWKFSSFTPKSENFLNELAILCLFIFVMTFVVFFFVKSIFKPLPEEIYQIKKNLIAIRFFKVLFIVLFLIEFIVLAVLVCVSIANSRFEEILLGIPISFCCTSPIFLILWGISYIVFGSGNPFFVFKYDPYKFYNQESLMTQSKHLKE